LIITFLKWIKDNLGSDAMEEMIFSKTEDGQTFLTYLLLNKKGNSIVKETMDLIKTEFSFDQQALKKLMGFYNYFQYTLLHYFATEVDNEIFLIEILKWIQDEFGMEDFVEITLTKNIFGNTFLSCIGLSKDENAYLKLLNVLNYLKIVFKVNRKPFENLIFSTNNNDKTILHLIRDYQRISDLENMLLTFIAWCNENLSKSQLEDLLFAENNEDKTFLHTLLETPDLNDEEDKNSDDESSEVEKHKECYRIFYKTVIQLHEIIDDKDKLKTLLEQKYKKSTNLIEFVTENCEDIDFFVDWLEQHPEYPTPPKFKQLN
jgi:hypothetical protein